MKLTSSLIDWRMDTKTDGGGIHLSRKKLELLKDPSSGRKNLVMVIAFQYVDQS